MTQATKNNLVVKAVTAIKPSDAVTVAGAAIAARRFQSTLQRASVTDDLGVDIVKEEIAIQKDALEPLASRLSVWRTQLGEVVAGLNKCRIYTIHDPKGVRMILVGSAADAATVRHLYRTLCDEVDRLTVAFGSGKGRTWCNNFRLNAISEITKALREGARQANEALRAEAAPDQEALTWIENAINCRARRVDTIANWMKDNQRALLESSHEPAKPRESIRIVPVAVPAMARQAAVQIPQTYSLWRYGMKSVFTKEERQVIALARRASVDPACDILPQEIIGDLLAICEAAEMRAHDQQETERPRLSLASKNGEA